MLHDFLFLIMKQSYTRLKNEICFIYPKKYPRLITAVNQIYRVIIRHTPKIPRGVFFLYSAEVKVLISLFVFYFCGYVEQSYIFKS